ncbi:MAG: UDP-N-acetylglucosamine 4,6-dehydratase (inverting) [Verrucomicrobia bacterium GWF2_51_19]|nr:MAG: UDP-N-acetylglucosamine 4,6-dehydratase (inverting) [Verrucomicrobia bacterium GWF2_51_19]HCJ12552.1 UDP-N-acetylglucosamine 4,6-dehydratase (inverting) [Opitutae bacterium]
MNGKSILVTGGTGSFGKQFCATILKHYKPKRLIIYSRDEFKQSEMAKEEVFQRTCMRFFLGDVRDAQRLQRAMNDVDIVVHAAALKQVPAAEYNPHEFIKTNIDGAVNVVEAALNTGVEKVVALSTDKAVNPINLYGATKLCSDKVFIAANSYSGSKNTRFSVVRYGNVIGSRGSVIPLFLEQKKKGALSITDSRMTRFFISLDEGVDFVIQCLESMVGGELFVPKISSCYILDIAKAIAPDSKIHEIGIRPGEKVHEVLIPRDESYITLEFGNHYLIQPIIKNWENGKHSSKGKPCSPDFAYSSNENQDWLSCEQLKPICRKVAKELAFEVDF